jgi:hypothetical protein
VATGMSASMLFLLQYEKSKDEYCWLYDRTRTLVSLLYRPAPGTGCCRGNCQPASASRCRIKKAGDSCCCCIPHPSLATDECRTTERTTPKMTIETITTKAFLFDMDGTLIGEPTVSKVWLPS